MSRSEYFFVVHTHSLKSHNCAMQDAQLGPVF